MSKHIRRTHKSHISQVTYMNNCNYIIPHHLKGVKHYNQNIKKILTYFKLIVFLVQYTIIKRISLDFCENGNRKESDCPFTKKRFLIKGGNSNQVTVTEVTEVTELGNKPVNNHIHRLPLFCEVVKYYE